MAESLSSLLATNGSIVNQNPFTDKDFDDFPPLPTLPPHESPQYVNAFSLDHTSSQMKLQHQNHQLKTEIAAIYSQRAAERQAYCTFIKSIECLNQYLPAHAKTPAMRLALQNLVEASRKYRSIARVLNEQEAKHSHHVEHPSNSSVLQPAQPAPVSFDPQVALGSQETATSFSHPQVKDEVWQHDILLVRQSLAKLQIPQPPHSSSSSLNAALSHLTNNIDTFAPLLVFFLNGRHKHINSRLRARMDAIIGGFFSDPADAKQVTDKILKALKDEVKYTEQDVESLGRDIVGPMGIVLWELVDRLERAYSLQKDPLHEQIV